MVTLPPPATSFEAWTHALQRHADSEALEGRLGLWRDLPWKHVKPIPLDHPRGANTNESAEHVEVVLTTEETNVLQRRTPGVIRKADLMLTALARTLACWTGAEAVLIDMMGHGRVYGIVDDIDPMETVGFFISYTPLVLRLSESGEEVPEPVLTAQIDPLLCHGLSFDLLRFMASDRSVREALRDLPRAEILFNYHGRLDEPGEVPRNSMFSVAPESSGVTHSPTGLRYYPIAVESKIHRGRLRLRFIYSTNLHEQSTVAGLGEEFRRQLNAVVSTVMS